jgi:hypothetical protein
MNRTSTDCFASPGRAQQIISDIHIAEWGNALRRIVRAGAPWRLLLDDLAPSEPGTSRRDDDLLLSERQDLRLLAVQIREEKRCGVEGGHLAAFSADWRAYASDRATGFFVHRLSIVDR